MILPKKINLKLLLALLFWLLLASTAFGQKFNCADEDFDCKIQAANKAIQAEPKNANNYLTRANAYDDKGDFDSALKDYNKAIELDAKNPLIYYNRGLAFYNHRDSQSAIDDFTKVIELDSKYALAYESRANVYDDLGKTELAMKDYSQAITLNPKYALAYINRGIAYSRQKQYNQAIEDFSSAIKLNSEYSAEAYKYRAATYNQMNETAEANADAEKYDELSNMSGNTGNSGNAPKSELRDATDSKYKVGQIWSYRTRAGEEDSYLVIVKVENHPKLGNIIHIAVMNLKMKRNDSGKIIDSANHLPFAESAINESVIKLLKENAELPNYQEGYNLWREAFDAHQAGIYTISVAKAVDAMEAIINQ